jgi:PhoH-like ATPase
VNNNLTETAAHAQDKLAEEVTLADVVVLDTSALVADPASLFAFPDAGVVLPLTVIEELDQLKTRQDSVGANARAVVRTLEGLRQEAGGTLSTTVPLPDGGTLRVEPNGLRLNELDQFHLAHDVSDHRILASALGLAADGSHVTVISCDGAMRLKADALGLAAQDYVVNNEVFDPREFPGWSTIETPYEFVDELHRAKRAHEDFAGQAAHDVTINEFVVARAGNTSALARRTTDGFELLRSTRDMPDVWGMRARNKEQQFALNLLTDPDVPVVALSGRAGTGKTLMAIAAALEQTMESGATYDRIMVLRPMYSVGRQDIGFLPGDVSEKTAPWFDAIVDAMVALSSAGINHIQAQETLSMWVEQGKLTMEPVTFLRGRSLLNTIVLVEESQNLNSSEVKTILTRLGQGSKVILSGDPAQIDNPYVSQANNGLTALIDAFRGQDIFGHVALTACERSKVADLAADLL